jgi:hypothetical protein
MDIWFEGMKFLADEVPVISKSQEPGECQCPHCTHECGHTWEEQEAAAKRIVTEKLSTGLSHIDRMNPSCPACWIKAHEVINEEEDQRNRVQRLLQTPKTVLA